MSIKNLVNFFQKKLTLLLVLIMGLVPLLWFRDGLLIAGGDFPIPLDPTGNFIKSFLYTWSPYLYGGQPSPHLFAILPWFGFWAFLKATGFSLLAINKLWFIFIFMLSGFSMYYLITVLFQKKADFILRFIAPLFYMFNVYVMVISPVMATPLLYSALPLILGFYIKGLNEKRLSLKYAALVALSSLLVSSAIGNPPIYAILGIMVFSYLVYHLISEGRKVLVFSLNFTLMTALLYLLVNLWWLCPYIKDVLMQQASVKEAIQPSPGSSPLYETVRLFGSWAFYAGSGGAAYFPFAHHYRTAFFILLTFSIPLLAFLAAFFKRRRKQIIYFLFMAIFGIWLAHGGVLYNFFYSHIPGFWIFREPFAKFTVLTAISFAILIGFSTSNIYKMLNSRLKNRNHLAKFYLMFVVLVILLTAWPILTGDAIFSQRGFMKSYHVEIPDYWFQAGEWFNNKKGNFRVLVLPENPESHYCGLSYQWGYGAADLTPYLIHQPLIEERVGLGTSIGHKLSQDLAQSLYDKIRNFDGRNLNVEALGQMLNIKYILQRNDVDWELISNENSLLFSPGHLRRALSSEKYLSLEQSLGDLDFYKISDKSFLPRFYIPQNIIYSNGNVEDLSNIASFGDYEIRSGIYLSNVTDDTDKKLITPIEGADEVFVKTDLEGKPEIAKLEIGKFEIDEAICLRGCTTEGEIFYPYAKHEPGSLMYKLALLKEEREERKARENPEKLVERKLFYASKRVSELEKFGIDEGNRGLAMRIMEPYQDQMEEAIDSAENVGQIERIWKHLEGHEEKLGDLKVKELRGWEEWEDWEGWEDWKEVFEKLSKKLAEVCQRPEFDLRSLEYRLEIPKEEAYEVYIKRAGIEKLRNWGVEIDGEKMMAKEIRLRGDGWINLGRRDLKEGEHKLILRLPEIDNLITKNWQQPSDFWLEDEMLSFSLQPTFPEDTLAVFQEIRNYTANAIFKLSFDYRVRNGKAGFSIIQDNSTDEETEETEEAGSLLTKVLRRTDDGEFKWAEVLVKSGPQASLTRIYLFAEPEEGKVVDVAFKNVKMERVLETTVVLRTQTDSFKQKQVTPRVTFLRVNPTKYRVKIEGAKEPYALVFSESFHKGWKAYIDKSQNLYEEVVTSYFNEEIREGEHRDIFLDRDTFETWGKKPIPEERHHLVNGYANSWYIIPQDSGGVEDYELIIEFQPQNLFYLGIGISLITTLGCLGYLIYEFVGRRTKR